MMRMDRSKSQGSVHSRDPSDASALRRVQRFLGSRKIVGRKRKRGFPPSDRRTRQQKRRGEISAYLIETMQHRHDGASFCPPTLQEMQQILGRVLVEGGEGLIEQDDFGVLQEQPCKQSPLELADGKFGDLSICNA